MAESSLLFPSPSRRVPGKRYLNIALRSLHLVGVAGLAGHFLYQLPTAQWLGFLWLGFFAHAPGHLRYYSVYHGRVVKALRDASGAIKDSGQL